MGQFTKNDCLLTLVMLMKGKLKRMGFLKVPSVISPVLVRIRPGLSPQLSGDTCSVHQESVCIRQVHK